jgi:hypothetical protein
MGPEQLAILPTSELKSGRNIRGGRQVYAQNLQQPSGITADRDPGPDFPKLDVLLEDLHRYRPLQQARREGKPAYTPANNGNVTPTSHVRRSP